MNQKYKYFLTIERMAVRSINHADIEDCVLNNALDMCVLLDDLSDTLRNVMQSGHIDDVIRAYALIQAIHEIATSKPHIVDKTYRYGSKDLVKRLRETYIALNKIFGSPTNIIRGGA